VRLAGKHTLVTGSTKGIGLGIARAFVREGARVVIHSRNAAECATIAETFGAADALAWGLADRVVPAAELDAAVAAVAADLAKGGPAALAEAKMLVDDVVASPASLVPELTAARIARLRASTEAQEGMSGFLEKRPPRWVK